MILELLRKIALAVGEVLTGKGDDRRSPLKEKNLQKICILVVEADTISPLQPAHLLKSLSSQQSVNKPRISRTNKRRSAAWFDMRYRFETLSVITLLLLRKQLKRVEIVARRRSLKAC